MSVVHLPLEASECKCTDELTVVRVIRSDSAIPLRLQRLVGGQGVVAGKTAHSTN